MYFVLVPETVDASVPVTLLQRTVGMLIHPAVAVQVESPVIVTARAQLKEEGYPK